LFRWNCERDESEQEEVEIVESVGMYGFYRRRYEGILVGDE